MSRFPSLSCLLLLGLLFIAVDETKAQRLPNYNRRPTVSPFINLFNSNQGGVNNYFSFVRPLQQQARLNQQQFNQNTRLQQQLQQNRLGAGQIGLGPLQPGTAGANILRPGVQGVGTASTAATFFNYSHYYPVPQQRVRR